MLKKNIIPLLFGFTFVMALVISALLLKPSPAVQDPQTPDMSTIQNLPELNTIVIPPVQDGEQADKTPPLIVDVQASVLSSDLQAVKDGKKSILAVIFSNEDLNFQLNELLSLSEQGEAWADYAIGQLAEMCTYLYETPESELIKMFSGASLRATPEQQAQMSELMPVIVNASQRCKTLDAEQLKSIGESRDWFDKAAEAGNPNAYVISGYSLVTSRLMAESDEYANALDESRVEIGKQLRLQAKKEFQNKMREFIVNGQTNPETIISMAEHLNLFYEDGHPFKQKEAWMLLACDQGYEDNCSSSSKAMSVFCMFDSSCATGGDFQQGVLWAQGQYKLDQYQQIADQLRIVFDTRDWDKLGF